MEMMLRYVIAMLKSRGKRNYMQIANVMLSNAIFEIGDKVLVTQDRENIFSTPFHPKAFTLVDNSGNSVRTESLAGSQYKRNAAHVKKLHEGAGKGTGYTDRSETDVLPDDDDITVTDAASPIDLELSVIC